MLRVRNRAEKLIASMETDTYTGYRKRFLHYLARMTSERFRNVRMIKDLPDALVTDDDTELSFAILSQGTKDTTSLALRLAMAEYFLQDARGFLILDDPFVEMDPGRQRSACSSIRELSEEKQVIVLTCRPDIAEALNGKTVRL